jgi:hypothetical protein
MWSYRDSHSLMAGMETGTATWEDTLAISYKTKHSLTNMIQLISLVLTQMS